MGQGIFLGEAYLPLQELEDDNMDRPLHDLAQLQIPLTRPQDHGKVKISDFMKQNIYINQWETFRV